MGCRLFPGWAGGMLAHCGKEKKQNTEKSTNRIYVLCARLCHCVAFCLIYLFFYLFIPCILPFYIFRVVVVLLSLLDATRNTKIQHTQTEQPGGLGKTRREINAASLFLIVILSVLFSIVVICFSL